MDGLKGVSPLVLDRLEVSYEQISNGLRKINTRKAPGADWIPPKLLQMVAQEVTPTVHHLFNTSLNTGGLRMEISNGDSDLQAARLPQS